MPQNSYLGSRAGIIFYYIFHFGLQQHLLEEDWGNYLAYRPTADHFTVNLQDVCMSGFGVFLKQLCFDYIHGHHQLQVDIIPQIALGIGVLTVLVKGPWFVYQSVRAAREHFLL